LVKNPAIGAPKSPRVPGFLTATRLAAAGFLAAVAGRAANDFLVAAGFLPGVVGLVRAFSFDVGFGLGFDARGTSP
jgi:hypothetical protein